MEILIVMTKVSMVIGGLMTAAAYLVLLERRVAAWVQDRIGPNRVGIPLTKIKLFGLGQPLADGLKFILKEEYTPAHVDKRLYVLAPIVILVSALAVFAVIPVGSVLPLDIEGMDGPLRMIVAPQFDVALIYVFALSSIAVYGVILGGWASNNKYSFLGALRSSAQLISYELPLGLGILGVVLASGTLELDEIIGQQARGQWFVIAQPLGFIVFFIAAFAEAARLPFDLQEAEQELVGGYHTEYSGMKLLLFLIAEFLHMVTASFLLVIMFFGGWHFPFITGASVEEATWVQAILRLVVFYLKIFIVIMFFMLVRWTWPRFRFDQLMALAWKVMLPLGIVNLVMVAILAELRYNYDPQETSAVWEWSTVLISWAVCIGSLLLAGYLTPSAPDNKPHRPERAYQTNPAL